MLFQAHGIVAVAVKALPVKTTEVAYTRQRDRDQTIEKFIHTVAAQSNFYTNRHAFTNLEVAMDLRALVTTGC